MLASKPKASLTEHSSHKEKEPSNSNSNPNPKQRARASSAPRVSRLTKPAAGSSKPSERRSPSPLHNATRATPLDKSSSSVDAPKASPPGERRSFKAAAAPRTPERQPRPIAKASELQAQLNLVQEDLKNAREHLASLDRDRAQVLGDLALTKRLADEAYQKLEESLAAQHGAEEALELERFKSVEREQAGIELSQRKEEEWERKYDGIRRRHAEDVASLISATREIDDVKGELAMAAQARDSAARRADEAREVADANANKVEILMAEVSRVRSEMASRAEEAAEMVDKLRGEATELKAEVQRATAFEEKLSKSQEQVEGLKVDIAYAKAESLEGRLVEITSLNESNEESLASLTINLKDKESQFLQLTEKVVYSEKEASELRAELQESKVFKEKLAKAEKLIEGLKVDIAYAKRAEMDASQLAEGRKTTVESLEGRLAEISSLNKSNEESLASLTKRFEDKQSELLLIKEKAASSEIEASQYKEGFLDTNRRLDIARKEASELQTSIDRLRSEHELLNAAHELVVSNEKVVSAQVSALTEDKRMLLQELDGARVERDKAKKTVEDLAAALRQVSSEAKERVLGKQTELENAQFQISELKTAMKNAEDRYKLTLDESNYEAACLRKTVERLGSEAKTSEEILKRSDEGSCSIKSEMSKMMETFRVAEKEVHELKSEKAQLLDKLKELDPGTMVARSVPEQTNAESTRIKDLLSRKEEEVIALSHETIDLRLREAAALAKANELSELLAQAMSSKTDEEEAARSAEKSNALLMKLEMDRVLGSLKAAERKAKAAKDDKARIENKLRLLESKITEAGLTAEEEKIGSLRLKETLAEKQQELLSIARENDGLRTREAAARAKADELSALLAQATSNGVAARSPEKQPNVFRKMMCSPMDNVVRGDDDEHGSNNDRIVQVEEIKHVEVETVNKQMKHEREASVWAVESNSLENSKIITDDLSKERSTDIDTESSDDDDIESQGDDGAVDQMDGLLIHGPTSSFKQDPHQQKKKKALLKKFGSMLKKKAHFTKLSNHS